MLLLFIVVVVAFGSSFDPKIEGFLSTVDSFESFDSSIVCTSAGDASWMPSFELDAETQTIHSSAHFFLKHNS